MTIFNSDSSLIKPFTFLLLLVSGITLSGVAAALSEKSDNDIIARVGDQAISFKEIDVMINSSSMVGLSLPPAGTPARNKLRLSLLDKAISANLLYLDAKANKLDQTPVYQNDIKQYGDTMLAALYREQFLVGEIGVSDKEIMDYFEKNIEKGTAFTKDIGVSIEAKLRKEKFSKKIADMSSRLREGVNVVINEKLLKSENDKDRDTSAILAYIDVEAINWNDIQLLLAQKKSFADRLNALNQYIDQRIMIKKAKDEKLDQSPLYLARLNEFKKVRLVNIHRNQLIQKMEPSKQDVKDYYSSNKDKIRMPEARKIQMLVFETEQQAEAVKNKIENGELTIFEAATQYSIDPNAKKNLGEIGWVPQGTGFPELDKLTFSLDIEKISDPVKSPAGWHLVKVIDVQEAAFDNVEDKKTFKKARRLLLDEKRAEYIVDLRKNKFKVEVYQDTINRLMNEESSRYVAKNDKLDNTQ
ncbi:MAG: peptidylprolyl isomerase [Gammaproteobacteria bacterium]|nr:peptidylprolyl isomerase [Gammaproteobacteria bacterium]